MDTKELMRARAEHRRNSYRTYTYHSLPDGRKLTESYFSGTYSLTLPHTRRRIVTKTNAVQYSDDLFETPTAACRDYLTLVYGRAPRPLNKSLSKIEKAANHPGAYPLHAEPCAFEQGYYVDIRKAFFSILCVAGWDIAYSPGEYLAAGRPPLDFPFPENGISRNSMVSSCASRAIPLWQPDQPREISQIPNGFYHPQLSILVRDVLHAIAAAAVRIGAVYVATDGYIVRSAREVDAVIAMVGDWGLSARVKASGPGAVYGTHSYRVGEMASIRQLNNVGHSDIRPLDYGRWLQARFASLAGRRLDG